MQKSRTLSGQLALCTALIWLATIAAAADVPSYHFDISDQSLSQALRSFGQISGQEIIFTEDLVVGVKAATVKGDFTAEDALTRLLFGTGLVAKRSPSGALMIRRAAPARSGATPGTTDVVTPNGNAVRLADRDSSDGATGSDVTQGTSSRGLSSTGPEDSFTAAATMLPEVLVRGSKGVDTDLTRARDDAQPYYFIGSDAIEQSGAVDMDSLLKQTLSMSTTAASNVQSSHNTGGNTSAVNLRGLGTNQTLILINGRRTANLADGKGGTTQADLNTIPLGMIDHIEVLPSSASAIYGGAAVGGVINVVLKHDYTGGNITAGYDATGAGGGRSRTLDGYYGFSLEEGRTNIMVGAHYSDAQPLLVEDRPDLTERGISTILQNNPALFEGPSSPFGAASTPNISSTNGSILTLKDGTSLGSSFTHVPPGYSGAGGTGPLVANAGTYNNQLANEVGFTNGLLGDLTTSPQIKSVLFNARREMTDSIELFTEYFYSSNVTTSLEGDFTGNFSVPVPASAPTNPFAQAVNVTYPNTTAFPFRSESDSSRWVGGGIFRLPLDWSAEADYTWNRQPSSTAAGSTTTRRCSACSLTAR